MCDLDLVSEPEIDGRREGGKARGEVLARLRKLRIRLRLSLTNLLR